MAYGSTPYVGDDPEKNGGHIESAQMTHSKCLVNAPWAIAGIIDCFHGQQDH